MTLAAINNRRIEQRAPRRAPKSGETVVADSYDREPVSGAVVRVAGIQFQIGLLQCIR
jgi:hypothetical protein